MTNIMIDLETLSLQPNAVVLSLGAVLFDEHQIIDTFYAMCGAKHQTTRHIDIDVVGWWAKQSLDADFDELINSTNNPNLISMDFVLWVNKYKFIKDVVVWGNGSDFDNVIINNFLAEQGARCFSYYNFRCFRTTKKLLPLTNDEIPKRHGVHHNALDDAIYQAQYLQVICKKYGVEL